MLKIKQFFLKLAIMYFIKKTGIKPLSSDQIQIIQKSELFLFFQQFIEMTFGVRIDLKKHDKYISKTIDKELNYGVIYSKRRLSNDFIVKKGVISSIT